MLKEIRHVSQPPGERFRRWFTDDRLELMVWYEPVGTIHGFQICYDLQSQPRALTWTHERGFSHAGVDKGEESVFSNRTPMLRSGIPCDVVLIRGSFLMAAADLPAGERNFVENKLAEFDGKT